MAELAAFWAGTYGYSSSEDSYSSSEGMLSSEAGLGYCLEPFDYLVLYITTDELNMNFDFIEGWVIMTCNKLQQSLAQGG